MNGILIVNKPTGYTSRDIVNIVGKILNTKKIGHTGTLDPLASGVLVLTTGRYTKLGELLTSYDKEYIAEIKLGIDTDTLDITGNILNKKDFAITKDDILNVFASFIGTYHMEVPKYSAIKINGKKLYEYARNNVEVELPVKDVQIYELELLDFYEDVIKFRCKVEKGTYVRSLIRDICKLLGTVGVMTNLVRIKQGPFSIDNAISLDDIKNDNYQLLNIKDVLPIKEYDLSFLEYQKVKNGNDITISNIDEYVLLKYNDDEIAIYKRQNNFYKCYVMLKID